MKQSEILEITRDLASKRFTPDAGQLEIAEKPAPPPFVDVQPALAADRSGVFFGLKHVDGGELQIWISASGAGSAYCMSDDNDGEIETFALPKFDTASQLEEKLNGLAEEFSEAEEFSDMDDDRIDCPFCGHMLFPGQKAAAETGWEWMGDVCRHTLFLAVDISAFSGFEYRSKLFNEHLGLPDSNDPEVEILADDAEEEDEIYLSVAEIIARITLPGLELRSYDDEGGIACGPCGGGTITFGFVPQETEPAGK